MNAFLSTFVEEDILKKLKIILKIVAFLLILPYESNTWKISIWLQLLFYSKRNCYTKLGKASTVAYDVYFLYLFYLLL